MDRSWINSVGLLVVILFLTSEAIAGYAAKAVDVGRVTTSTTEVYASYTFKTGTRAANDARYVGRVVNFGKATLGSLVRRRLFSPWGAAMAAAMVAADYYLNDQTWEVTQQQTQQVQYGQICFAVHSGNGWPESECLATKEAACASLGGTIKSDGSGCLVPTSWGTGLASFIQRGQCPSGTNWNGSACIGEVVTETPLSDTDIGDWALNNLTPTQIRDILVNPETGLPEPYPELQTVQQDVSNQFDVLLDGDPNTVPEPQFEDDVTEEKPEKSFCDYATVVCDFIEWMKEEPADENPPSLPTEVVGGELVPYSSGLGGGSCPAAATFTLNGQTMQIPIQPSCDLMTMFRPFLLGLSYLVAGFIVAGVRSGG